MDEWDKWLTLPLQEGYSKWFRKMSACVSGHTAVPRELDTVCLCVWFRSTAKTGHSWTSTLGMYTLLQSGKNEHSLIFIHYTRSYQKGQENFQSSRLFLHLTNHTFHITGRLNDSSFQQSKLKSLNMYTNVLRKL